MGTTVCGSDSCPAGSFRKQGKVCLQLDLWNDGLLFEGSQCFFEWWDSTSCLEKSYLFILLFWKGPLCLRKYSVNVQAWSKDSNIAVLEDIIWVLIGHGEDVPAGCIEFIYGLKNIDHDILLVCLQPLGVGDTAVHYSWLNWKFCTFL